VDPNAAVSPLAALLAVIGSLLLTLGLGELLLGGRGKAGPSAIYAGSAPSPPGRPAPLTIDGGAAAHPKSGGAALLNAGRSPLPVPGGGDVFPASPSPAPSYQAVILGPAGKWGSYWQEIGRCGHRHGSIDAAYDCVRSLRLEAGEREAEDYVLGVGWAE